MKLSDIVEILSADLCTSNADFNMDILYGRASDLLSDVLRFPMENAVLLTGLVNPQVIRTAEMVDIKAIVFVRDKVPTEEMIELAEELGIILMTTKHKLYRCCGLLYNQGLFD
ncbi:MAG: hypothetical protein ACOYVK_18545 [Bacillota bacterium]